MPVNWIDVTSLSFNVMLLLERVQLSWFPGWLPENNLAIALRANPVVEWYMRHKCPEINEWLDEVIQNASDINNVAPEEVRRAEEAVIGSINDLVTYVVAPEVYDAQPFLAWDSEELSSLVDFSGKIVIDIGSGTGKLALIAAEKAEAVYAVEPVANLRQYLRKKAGERLLWNIFPVDGLITDIPFPDNFADIAMGGHVFGDNCQQEYAEMIRVTKPSGMVILCPAGAKQDDDRHNFLRSNGFEWSQFHEPGEGMVRKYWKRICEDK